MGRRNQIAELLIAIVDAFHEQRTWTQAGLAKRLGVEPRKLRALLDILIQTNRFPLERSVEGNTVYWSLPKGWVPGGVVIADPDVAPLARLLARTPRGALRDRVLVSLIASSPPHGPQGVAPETIATPERSDWEERMLSAAETSAAQHVALAVRYYTASRGEESTRFLSVQRIDAGPPARLFAYCHTAKELRTFRVDRMRGCMPDRGVAFVRMDEAEVAAYVGASVDGYHGPGKQPVACRFTVRYPEARWVEGNLLTSMVAKPIADGIEVTVVTPGVERVARFVVGLGEAAVVATPELRDAVRAFAEGALRAVGPAH
jgi:predicted DNA-binding transcriptional regulator YafY